MVLAPTARGFLTLFPGDVTNPGTANLNFVADQAPTPNAANIPLSPAGTFNVFNAFGEVHVVIDVNGFYQPSSAIGSQGPQGPQGDPGPSGTAGDPGTGRATFGDPIANYSAKNVGAAYNAAVSTDTFGAPIISHTSGTTLYVERCTSANCITSLQSSVTDAAFRPTSIRAMSGDEVAVLYEEESSNDVRLAMCDVNGCSTALIQVDAQLGSNSALTRNSLGFPMMVSRTVGGELTLTSCDDPSCSSKTTTDLGSSNGGASITTDGSGHPVISHYALGTLEVITCDTTECTSSTRNTIANTLGSRSTIKIGTDGNPVIVYEIARLIGETGTNLVVCADPECASSTNRRLDDPASGSSLVIMPDGRPVITTSRPTDNQFAYICDDAACETGTSLILQEGSPAVSTSITLGPAGNPIFVMDLELDLGIGAISWPSWSPNISDH